MNKWYVIQIHEDTKRIIIVDITNNRPQALQDCKYIESLTVVSREILDGLRNAGYLVLREGRKIK